MVTVVMPAYNCEKYLEEAVYSVIAQTYQDWKLLIIDDDSTDGTRALAGQLAEKDKRINVLHNETNIGVGATRNRGVQEADTEWIAFLDSDDKWKEDKLKKQLDLISEQPNAKIVFTGSGFMKENGERLRYVLHVPDKINRKQLLKQNVISCSSVLVKRDLLIKYPMPESRTVHEDFLVWLKILQEQPYAYAIDEPLLIYRRTPESKSSNKIHAAYMNWNTYGEAGLNLFRKIMYMMPYTALGIKKNLILRKQEKKVNGGGGGVRF